MPLGCPERIVECSDCDGLGEVPAPEGEDTTCATCGGSGEVDKSDPDFYADDVF